MNRLSELRRKMGLKQSELAEQLGVVQATLSNWENERYDIDNASLQKLADYFNVTIDYFLGRSDDSSPPDTKKEAPSTEEKALMMKKGLNELGIGNHEDDLTDAELKALMEFVDRNIDLIKLRAKQLEEGN